MRRLLTTLVTTTALALALTLPLTLPLVAAGAAQAAGTLEIKPGKLPRGADESVAHLDGTTIVDGDTRIDLPAARALLHGKVGKVYVASLGNDQWGNVRLVKVTATGTVKVLRTMTDPFNTLLDAQAGQVAYSYGDSTQKPTIGVYDLALRRETIVNVFSSLPSLLDFDEGLVVATFSSAQVRSLTWDTVSDDLVVLNDKQGWQASKAHDLFAYFSKDPFRGGCMVLARLSDPTDRLWTSCDERIEAISPDGRRLATIPLLSDGIGPADVLVRKVDGVRLAHYAITGYFGAITWETPRALLMESHGRTQTAVVRCVVTVCDRASDLSPTEPLRPLAG